MIDNLYENETLHMTAMKTPFGDITRKIKKLGIAYKFLRKAKSWQKEASMNASKMFTWTNRY